MENNNSMFDHLQHLCVEIGERPSGSAANQAASEYIQAAFQAAGWETEQQDYDCPAWECRQVRLEWNGVELECVANAFSPGCDVQAEYAPLGTIGELEKADLGGRIAVLYGDLSKQPLSAKSWFLKDEHDDRVITLLEEKQPLAIVTIQPKPASLDRIIEDWEFRIPSVTVPAEVGLQLLRSGVGPLGVKINTSQSQGSSCNVVGRKAGSSQKRIVLCAHYDTKFGTPGACDNAAGVAVLMEMARRLGQRDWDAEIELVAFSSEEYLPIGDDEYLRREGDALGRIVAAINMDLIAQYLGATSIAIFSASQQFQAKVEGTVARFPGVVWVEPWPQSNHSTFAMRGVPSLALSSAGASHNYHEQSDRIEWVSPARLGEVAQVLEELVRMVDRLEPEDTRPAED